MGFIIGLLGLIGLYRDRLPLIRILAFHSLFSIVGDMSLLLIVLLILTTSSHTSSSYSTSLCETIANDSLDWGVSIENCEERWPSVFAVFLGLISIMIVLRSWGGITLLTLAKKLGRRNGNNIRIDRNLERERYLDDQSLLSSTSSSSGKETKIGGQRIFLLPNTTGTDEVELVAEGESTSNNIPMVPIPLGMKSHQFPPNPNPNHSLTEYDTPFLVYAPVSYPLPLF